MLYHYIYVIRALLLSWFTSVNYDGNRYFYDFDIVNVNTEIKMICYCKYIKSFDAL